MTRISLIYILWVLLSCTNAKAQDAWVVVKPGLEMLQGNFEDHGQKISFVLVRCDPRRNQVQIIDTFHELGRGNAYAAYSLRQVKAKTGAIIVTNAGSTASFSLPAPTGLLKIGGRIVSPVNRRAQTGGILCVNRERVSILALSDVGMASCTDAVQRGPYMSRESVSAQDSNLRSQRTAVAVDANGSLLILVTKEGITLSSLATFLYSSKLNLNVQAVLNLDGGVSSGLLATNGTSSEIAIGNTDALVASAVAIDVKPK
jgi:uncharacterized protein YigE (DUF2233 family)